jgi:hypothetical protein
MYTMDKKKRIEKKKKSQPSWLVQQVFGGYIRTPLLQPIKSNILIHSKPSESNKTLLFIISIEYLSRSNPMSDRSTSA